MVCDEVEAFLTPLPPLRRLRAIGSFGVCAAMERGRIECIGVNVTRELVGRARELRAVPTWSEELLWGQLRDRRFRGVKFRRQVVIGRFIVDFLAPQYRLIVEVDGDAHADQHERDEARQQNLEARGYCVLRFSADAIENNLTHALSIIAESLHNDPSPSPSPHVSLTNHGPRAMERGPGGEGE
jgi:very-short-patch-repair endonuclease